MKIRSVTYDDVANVRSLVETLSCFYMKNNEGSLPEWFVESLTTNEFTKRLNSENFDNFLCELDSELAGYISIRQGTHLYHLFVAEKYQGRGVARALWQHSQDNCLSAQCTLRSSLSAVPVYKKFGFVESGPVQVKDGIYFQPMIWQRTPG